MSAKRHQVFLSYATKDRKWVSQVAVALAEIGVASTFDEGTPETRAQVNLLKDLRAGVEQSTLFVLFLSQNALRSPWITFEVGMARGLNVPVILVTRGEISVPHPLSQFHIIVEPSPKRLARRLELALANLQPKGA
jgi:hypothetical protein